MDRLSDLTGALEVFFEIVHEMNGVIDGQTYRNWGYEHGKHIKLYRGQPHEADNAEDWGQVGYHADEA